MKNKFILVSALCFLFSYTSYAHTAKIYNSGDSEYKKVKLTREIYNNSEIKGLRLKGKKTIPYFINSGFSSKTQKDIKYPLSLINSYQKEDCFYFDYKLSNNYNSDIICTGLIFSSESGNFLKKVSLYGGYDNINWEYICDAPIYQIDDKNGLEINFPYEKKVYSFSAEAF